MENLDKLLEYQKIDIELRKVLDEIERSDDNKKMEQARTEFNNAKSTVTETEKAAESIVSYYNNALAFYDESGKKIDEIAKKMEETDDLEVQRELAAQLEKIRDKMLEIEKRISSSGERTEKVLLAYLDGQERGKKMRSVFNNVKERLIKFKQDKEPVISELKKKMDAIRPSIPSDVMNVYNTITSERRYPAFVKAIETEKGNYRCFCGLELSHKAKSELMDKGQCRCETCRRLIYTDK